MFSKFELTNKGVGLLNRVIAEQKTLKFTRFQIGKGDFSGDKKTLTQLVSKIDEFDVSQTNVLADGITNIKGFYDNRNLSVASKLTEIGIMAQLGDDNLTEVLFSYSNQPNTEAETIPSKESYFSRTFSVMNRTDNVTSVTFDLTIRQDKYNFGTLAEMKTADYLDIGDKVTLWGNAALGDSSFKMYIITDQAQPIQLNNKLYAKEYFAIVNDLTTGGAYKALSGEMGKKLDADKPSKNKEETITNYWTFEGRTPFIKFKKTGEQSLPSAGYSAFIGFGSSSRPHELQINNLYDDGTVNIKSADLKTENKNITKAINEVYDNQLGNTGILEVIYIQDSGTKTKGLGYVDKITKKVYLCINTNTDTSITSNFILATNVDTARKIDDMIGSSTKLELKDGDYFVCSAAFIQLSSGMVFVSGTFRLKSNYTYNRKLPDWAIPKTKQNLFMTALSSASSQNVSTLGFVVDTDGYVKTEYGYSDNNVTGSWIYSIR